MPSQPDNLDELLERGYRYALSLTHDRQQAEDLLQEACLGVVRSGAEWSVGYLLTIIRNRFIDDYRRRRKIPFHPLKRAGDVASHPEPAASRDTELEQALAALRPEEREALYLTIIEQMSTREAARLMQRPAGTVMSLVHRAKRKLRQILLASRQR